MDAVEVEERSDGARMGHFKQEEHLRGSFLFTEAQWRRRRRRQINPGERTAQPVSWHLPRQEERGGVVAKEHEPVGRRKNPAASEPEPRAASSSSSLPFFSLRSGRGEAERLLAPSVHVFCIPALAFCTERALVCSAFK